jgi:homoserine dehydrogenase
MATGNSVAADIMAIAKQIVMGNKMQSNCSCFTDKDYVEELKAGYYTRMNVINKPGVLAKIAAVFGNFGVSIESVLQKKTEGDKAEIVWITAKVGESSFRKAIEAIESLDVVNSISSIIRVENLSVKLL